MEELIQFINQFQKLDRETEEAIKSYFKNETYRKNDFILKEGQTCLKVSFIKKGLVRRFYINDGQDITSWIYYDQQWLMSIASYFEQKPSFEYLQACENTELFSLSYENEQRLLEYPLFAKFHMKILRRYLGSLNEFHHKYKLMSGIEKYDYILGNFPKMVQRAKLKHIASLMDVSQETLSRIRASII